MCHERHSPGSPNWKYSWSQNCNHLCKEGDHDFISCRTLESSGHGSKQKSTFCKMVSQTHSVESLGWKHLWLRDTSISCYISRHGFMTLLPDFSSQDISYSWPSVLQQLGLYQRHVFSMPENKLQTSDFMHTHRETWRAINWIETMFSQHFCRHRICRIIIYHYLCMTLQYVVQENQTSILNYVELSVAYMSI